MNISIKDYLRPAAPKHRDTVPGSIFVSNAGSDANDGSAERPFATIERALESAVRGSVIFVADGTYRTDGIRLTEKHSGITLESETEGGAVLCGSITIEPESFRDIPASVAERLHGAARGNVRVADLKEYGLTPADWGKLCPTCTHGTENKYDSYVPGTNCELFVGGRRMRVCRYPTEGMLKLDEVADTGDCFEFPAQNYYFDWKERRNHRGGIYIMDKETARRAAGWKEPDKVWMYGFPAWDWADMCSPVSMLDPEHRRFSPAYVSYYGAYKGGQYRFFNVLEELDTPGEWYLDRENGLLYIYPPCAAEECRAELTITRGSLITLEGADDVIIDGFALMGARGDALNASGSRNIFRNLHISCVLGNGISLKGTGNTVTGCDITATGKGGIVMDGGDITTLTPGGNTACGNYIHDWAQVYTMYNAGVQLDGVGNICAHNELACAPHCAILYYGPDHVMEYNYIHDVVQHACDAGAVYSGQTWTYQGCTVRWNVLENVGNAEFSADGIYFDDILSGQSAYGNILINIAKNGFLAGGGFNIHIRDNIIINTGTPLKYDSRGRDGFSDAGWMHRYVDTPEGGAWKRLHEVPFRSSVWAERFPLLAAVSEDFSDPANPHFPVNPAFSTMCDNTIIDSVNAPIVTGPYVTVYSEVHDNECADTKAGDVPDLRGLCAQHGIPLDDIGLRWSKT